MIGRNDPRICGSGEKDKKCGERVILFQNAEKMKESRDRERKVELFADLERWFHRHWNVEEQNMWANKFKKLLSLPLDKAIPKQLTFLFHYWLLFDAECMKGKRPVELWMSTIRQNPEKDWLLRSFKESLFTCYEVVDITEDSLHFRSLLSQREYEVIKDEAIPKGELVFARLLRVGNRYELLGPYTSFVHEMRGEILVQLEKYHQQDDEQQKMANRETGWRVLGWSIQHAQELENIEKLVSTPSEILENMRENLLDEADRPGLPIKIIQQLEQFYVSQVLPLSQRTQVYYSRSLDTLFQYLSLRFGKSFRWSLLTEDVFNHFFSVWYLDHNRATPIASKIFLNTCKHLFRWLYQEGISTAYEAFKKVYVLLIRALPITIEARKWMMENGVQQPKKDAKPDPKNMFILAVSSSGPVLLIGDRWKSLQMSGFPLIWSDYRFWVKGTVCVEGSHCYLTRIENVYPLVSMEENWISSSKVLGQR